MATLERSRRGDKATIAIAALLVAAGLSLPLDPDRARAATPDPAAGSSVVMAAQPMLGGNVRSGAWAPIRVTLENNGPAIDGELRLSVPRQAASTYALAVQLAPGARQEHYLYGQSGALDQRLVVSLVSGSAVLASESLRIAGLDDGAPTVFLIADHPEGLVGPVRDTLSGAGGRPPEVATIAPEDLPPRVEAWSSIDVLVWQDVESNRLDAGRLAALQTWAAMGGDLVILGGSTGTSTLGAFPAEMLPYRPREVVDVAPAELAGLLGNVPSDTSPLPAVAGPLERGSALAHSGESVVAARAQYGQGTVTLIGFDPSMRWLVATPAAAELWRRVLPRRMVTPDARLPADDGFLVDALGNLPTVQLPRSDHLLLLLLGYIVAIGPLNYFVLRRRDRRELAWITMPLTIASFAVAAFFLGVVLRGGNVVVHELTVVHGSAGTDRGLADAHIAVFSPSRATFDVRVGGAALISPSASSRHAGERPLDVLLGDSATIRDYGIGFGALRAFRAAAAVDTPRVEADLRLANDALEGNITNASNDTLADVSMVYGGAVQMLGDLAPGETRAIQLSRVGRGFDDPLWWRLFPPGGVRDGESPRAVAARRAIIQHLDGGWEWMDDWGGRSRGLLASGPVILAWASGNILEVDVGTPAQHVGETLFVLPTRVAVSGPVVFGGGLIEESVVSLDALDGWAEGGSHVLNRGTLVADYRPADFEGTLEVTALSVGLSQERRQRPVGAGVELAPLPADEQPDPDAPLASNPRPNLLPELPRLQLFDRAAGRWVEFEPLRLEQTYHISDPARYVDEAGAFSARFVARGDDYFSFIFNPRVEGNVR